METRSAGPYARPPDTTDVTLYLRSISRSNTEGMARLVIEVKVMGDSGWQYKVQELPLKEMIKAVGMEALMKINAEMVLGEK